MNVERFTRLINHLLLLANDGVYVPVIAHGEAGVGKSDTYRAIARQTAMAKRLDADKIGYVDLRLGQMEVGDLIGLPYRDLDGKQCFSMPDWFPTEGVGILALEEVNRSRLEARQAIFQLILDRRMHNHVLPPGWIVVAAVNPATEDYQLDDIYDQAFKSRFCHIAFEPSAEEWIEHATSENVDWSLRALVMEDKKFLGKRDVKLPDIKPTARTLSILGRVMQGMSEDLIHEVAIGLIGIEATTAWMSVRSSPARPVKGDDVLDRYKEVARTVKSFTEGKTKRTDLLRLTAENVVAECKVRVEGGKMTPNAAENLCSFLLDLPEDLMYAYLKHRLWKITELTTHFHKHKGIYAAIARINAEAGIKVG